MSDFFKQHEQALQQMAWSIDQLITEYGNQINSQTHQKLMSIKSDILNYSQHFVSTLHQELQGTKNATVNAIPQLLAEHQSVLNQTLEQELTRLISEESQAITTGLERVRTTSQSIEQALGLMELSRDSLTQMVEIQEQNQAKIKKIAKMPLMTMYHWLMLVLGIIAPLLIAMLLWIWTGNLNSQRATLAKEKEDLEQQVTKLSDQARDWQAQITMQKSWDTIQALNTTRWVIYTPKKNNQGEPYSITYSYRHMPTNTEIDRQKGTVTIKFQ